MTDDLDTLRALVEAHLVERLPPAGGDDPLRLREAMRYAVLSGGKRLRPILVLFGARAVAPAMEPVPALLDLACAMELVHCYSLVHDDLPIMDDDDERRGRPTVHRVFGEPCALLAGSGLLTLAFEWLADATAVAETPRVDLAGVLARAAGHAGMVGGQARDLALAGAVPDLATLERLHAEKTSALFAAAPVLGGGFAGGRSMELACLERFGRAFGIAFQHVDDLDDAEHARFAPQAAARARVLLAEARIAADALGPGARPLTDLARSLGDKLPPA